MKIDLTVELTKDRLDRLMARSSKKGLMSVGHFGTHFDAMGKIFPLEFTESRGVIFDVSAISEREIDVDDVDFSRIRAEDFVLLRTGVTERLTYGSEEYFADTTQLSWALIEKISACKVRMIGVDRSGIRNGTEHPKADNYCAERGVFVVENLVNLDKLRAAAGERDFVVHICPWNIRDFTGIPSRVVAELA